MFEHAENRLQIFVRLNPEDSKGKYVSGNSPLLFRNPHPSLAPAVTPTVANVATKGRKRSIVCARGILIAGLGLVSPADEWDKGNKTVSGLKERDR